ncbi:carboxysome shell carbonic anhydrase [Leclercia adecarboxylata]|uniref:Carboxysome shell carbonic anhydrase n=1 Tax=Leclercia adecarboxylata TaxID=83655 RepID=A0A9X3Y9Q7_9ENTR|nr:hypothetical protein [Leclercia adecarboxylata]MBD1402481.1 hypothetical protein [Leclercia adecarboxylata]MDC6622197.1 carboxysome shell carbonic anhydrase [Leclercia adecarboxylata]MDC6633269.1 carboxysome shell carbonic anhydrase [Leclercia adecarboxylata]MDC6638807.1 carboxysome shell carbonic anhydrase [Leclercia adecarboxylata]MDC6649245.1 carboxysome shell carbonic anhydrase [Leclercia adecarboxylata]
MTVTKVKSGPPAPAHIDPDALERAIAAARKIKDANPDRYKSLPAQPEVKQ